MIRTGIMFEKVLARLYCDKAFRARFLEDPTGAALREGLTLEEAQALAAIDLTGLDLASRSFAFKRQGH